MAITSLDGAVAGMKPPRFFFKQPINASVAGRAISTWNIGGVPSAGVLDTTLNGVTLSSSSALVQGQVPVFDPVSGNSYIARLVADCAQPGKLLLCDRLWHNGGITAVTTAQSITSPTWPARDINGATSGEGVLLGLEYNTTGAANAPTISVSYTNSAGTSGRTGTNVFTTAASPPNCTFFPISLAAGDTGVSSVQSITFSAAPTAGSCGLVAYRVIASLECPQPYVAAAIDVVTGGMPQLYNGTVPFFVAIPAVALSTLYVSGSLATTQG